MKNIIKFILFFQIITLGCCESKQRKVIPVDVEVNGIECESHRPEGWKEEYASVDSAKVDGVEVYSANFDCKVKEGRAAAGAWFAPESPSRYYKPEFSRFKHLGRCIVFFRIQSEITKEQEKKITDTMMTVLTERAKTLEECNTEPDKKAIANAKTEPEKKTIAIEENRNLLSKINCFVSGCNSINKILPQVLEEDELQCWGRAPDDWKKEYAFSQEVVLGGARSAEVIYDCIHGMEQGHPNEWGPYRALVQAFIPDELKKKDREGSEYFKAGKCAVLFIPAYEAYDNGDPKEKKFMLDYRIRVGKRLAQKAAQLSECK